MSAYVVVVFVKVGLSSRRGKSDSGVSLPGGRDLPMSKCKLSSIHLRASGKLARVVTILHFCRVTDSTRKNHDCRSRCS